MRSLSLRARLTLVILAPLLAVALAVGFWAWRDAARQAEERFDRSLASTALAITRDVALSGGDALRERTRDLIRDTSGGSVFYHVHAPDGVYVTGYATPPVPPPEARVETAPVSFDALYRGRPVRALRFTDEMTMGRISGPFTFTVWQDAGVRARIEGRLAARSFIVIGALLAALTLIVWFGVRIGLRPLGDLEAAIARRSPEDLSPLRRPVPPEVGGIVSKLNALLGDLAGAIRAKDAFISDAAHQLRNPLAGVMALSEAVRASPDMEALRERSDDLVVAAREASSLAASLLAHERARSAGRAPAAETAVDLAGIAREQAERLRPEAEARGVRLTVDADGAAPVRGDPVLLGEAVGNLVSNALAHGGPALAAVGVSASEAGGQAVVEIRDDGRGIAPGDVPVARARFGQVRPAAGSGLGLPIAEAIAEAHSGTLAILPGEGGARVRLSIPRAGSPAPRGEGMGVDAARAARSKGPS